MSSPIQYRCVNLIVCELTGCNRWVNVKTTSAKLSFTTSSTYGSPEHVSVVLNVIPPETVTLICATWILVRGQYWHIQCTNILSKHCDCKWLDNRSGLLKTCRQYYISLYRYSMPEKRRNPELTTYTTWLFYGVPHELCPALFPDARFKYVGLNF